MAKVLATVRELQQHLRERNLFLHVHYLAGKFRAHLGNSYGEGDDLMSAVADALAANIRAKGSVSRT